MMCNVPRGGGVYTQMVRAMAKPRWTRVQGHPGPLLGWIEPYNYFGDDLGNIYQMHPQFQYDEHVVGGVLAKRPITIDVQTAWSQFKTPAIKHFKMILPYTITDGFPKPAVDVKVDYDERPARSTCPTSPQPMPAHATWDTSPWAMSDDEGETPWVSGTRNWANWTGVGSHRPRRRDPHDGADTGLLVLHPRLGRALRQGERLWLGNATASVSSRCAARRRLFLSWVTDIDFMETDFSDEEYLVLLHRL